MKCFQANRGGRWNDRKPSTQKEARKERKSNIVQIVQLALSKSKFKSQCISNYITKNGLKDCQTGFCKNDMLFGSYKSKT